MNVVAKSTVALARGRAHMQGQTDDGRMCAVGVKTAEASDRTQVVLDPQHFSE